MPGPSNSNNKFGPSSLVVGPVLGNGCNYNTIQSAINAAVSGDVILVRSGTYAENLTLKAGVEIHGVAADGRLPFQTVTINGNHTYADDGFTALQFITFSSGLANVFDITSFPGGSSYVALKNCRLDSIGGKCLNIDGTPGSAGVISISTIYTSPVVAIDALNASVQLIDCVVSSAGTTAIVADAGTGINMSNNCSVSGVISGVTIADPISNCIAYNCEISANNGPAILFTGAGNAVSYGNRMGGSGGAGFYIEGAGNYRYANDIVNSTNKTIDPATTVTVETWKPFTTAGTTLTAIRGTAAFDSTQFTVTDGFVQSSGGNSPIFTDVSGVVAASTNNGYYATAATTITLDVAAVQGDLFIIYADTAAAVVVTANAGQTIRVAAAISAVAGTATSTAIGDSLTLRFRAATSCWECVSVVGNWVVV